MGINDEIAKVAYELYEKKGRINGRHVEDWIEAEKIVMARHAAKKPVKSKQASGGIVAAANSPKEEKSKALPKSSKKKTAVRRSSAEKTW